MLVCMLIIISKVEVKLGDAFLGFLPSKYIFAQGGVYTCQFFPKITVYDLLVLISPTPAVGIIGATVMPHSLFLGSTLSTQDRVNFRDKHSDKTLTTVSSPSSEQPSWLRRFLSACKETIFSAFRKPPANLYAANATRHSELTNNSYEFVRAHIYHGTVDMIGSLLGFAVVINSLFVF